MENEENLEFELEEQTEEPEQEQQKPEPVQEDKTDWKAEAAKWRRIASKKNNPKREESKQYNILEDEVFDYLNEGYSKDEIKFIMANGGRDALKDPNSLVSIAVKTRREQREAEKASSQTSNKSGFVAAGKEYTPEQLSQMSVAELEKILPHAE